MGLSARQENSLEQLMFGTRRRIPSSGGMMEECKIHHVNAQGVWFTRPSYDGSPAHPNGVHLFGPAPYTWPVAGVTGAAGTGPHTHTIPVPTNLPVLGDRCLVVWVGARDTNPWVLGWWPA